MNEELTRVFEKYELEAMIVYYKNNDCSRRVARELAASLLAEMEKPNDDVWEFAPKDATVAEVYFGNMQVISSSPDYTFTRELPKTRARQIAEQEGQGLAKKNGWSVTAGALVANVVEAALTKYAEELKGEA